MNRIAIIESELDGGIPHLCGDEPDTGSAVVGGIKYSPLVWG